MVKALFDTNILIDFLNGNIDAKAELAAIPKELSVCDLDGVLAGATDDTRGNSEVPGVIRIRQITRPIAENAALLRRRKRLELPDAIIWATAQVEGISS